MIVDSEIECFICDTLEGASDIAEAVCVAVAMVLVEMKNSGQLDMCQLHGRTVQVACGDDISSIEPPENKQ